MRNIALGDYLFDLAKGVNKLELALGTLHVLFGWILLHALIVIFFMTSDAFKFSITLQLSLAVAMSKFLLFYFQYF